MGRASSGPSRIWPSSQQEQTDGWKSWYMDSPPKTYPMRHPAGSDRPQEQHQQSPHTNHRQNQGTITITPNPKVFEKKIVSMKDKQFDGDKGGEKWRTDTMNYFIGRAPDIESLLLWAEHRSRQGDPRPTFRNEVDSQATANGLDPSV